MCIISEAYDFVHGKGRDKYDVALPAGQGVSTDHDLYDSLSDQDQFCRFMIVALCQNYFVGRIGNI